MRIAIQGHLIRGKEVIQILKCFRNLIEKAGDLI